MPHNFKKVIVTKHCKERARQRLRLLLREHELADLDSFLKREFSKAYKDMRLHSVPFYSNRLGNTVVYKTAFVKFYTIVEGETVVLKPLLKIEGSGGISCKTTISCGRICSPLK